MRMRADVSAQVGRLLAKKQADKYVTRSGGPPSLLDRELAAKSQDLLEDDRKTLQFSVKLIKRALRLHPSRDDNVARAWSFIEAVLDRDYGLSLGCDRDTDGTHPHDSSDLFSFRPRQKGARGSRGPA